MYQSRLSSASKSPEKSPEEEVKKGFTIIEVMLFLAISGLLLMGVIGGTYAAIATQRYNDSVRSFAEFLRQIYAEVISPESIGDTGGGYGGNSDQYAIYGKVAVFGLNDQSTVYTATLVGDVSVPTGQDNFMDELKAVGARLFCGIETSAGVTHDTTVDSYTPLWEVRLQNPSGSTLQGTLIIARSPTSGIVHTAYYPSSDPPDLSAANGCNPGAGNQVASDKLYKEIQDNPSVFKTTDDINFCIKSDQSNIIRDVLLTADGHNNTAINLLDESDARNACR